MTWALVLGVLLVDQISKFFITKNLFLNQSLPIINNIFHLTLIHNQGAAFGILKNHHYLFFFTGSLAVILIILNLKDKKNRIYRFSLGLILAGALGNMIDRFFLGYVIDFLDFRIWPVFNIADCAISLGAILLAWTVIKEKKCIR